MFIIRQFRVEVNSVHSLESFCDSWLHNIFKERMDYHLQKEKGRKREEGITYILSLQRYLQLSKDCILANDKRHLQMGWISGLQARCDCSTL